MSDRTCPVVIDQCVCEDPPVLNISSEAPDPLIFTGVGYSPYDPWMPAPLGNGMYLAKDCYGVAYSVLSQELADLLAKMNAIICQQSDTTNGWLYSNDAQTAYISCGALSTFWYTVAAGTFVATFANPTDGAAWVAAANASALAYAQSQVSRIYKCISCPILSADAYWMCSGDGLSVSFPLVDIPFTLSGRNTTGDFNFEVSSGSLPPGLYIVQTSANAAALGGNATTPGNYTFNIRATSVSNSGIYSESTCTIDVIGVTNSPLPSGTVGTAYSEQINVTGGTAPYTFVATTALPAGLSMDTAGLITGTPTTADP